LLAAVLIQERGASMINEVTDENLRMLFEGSFVIEFGNPED